MLHVHFYIFFFFQAEDGIRDQNYISIDSNFHAPHRLKMITYKVGNDLDLNGVIDLYRASTLGERRPVDDRDRMAAMIRNANLVITAWDNNLLVGIARSLTDFCYVTYLSDLAV